MGNKSVSPRRRAQVATLHRVSALSLGCSNSRSDAEKGVTLICYSTTIDLSGVFGLGKKLLCDLSAEQDYCYLLPKGWVQGSNK